MPTYFNNIYDELSTLFTESENRDSAQVIAFLLPNTKNGYLSNWYPSAITIYGKTFSSGEQAFMWAKADTFMDDEIKAQILLTDDPKKLKALGRKIKNFNEAVWSSIREDLMTEIVAAKFEQNPSLLDKLLSTGDAILAEANNYDKFWGCGLRASDSAINDTKNWPGKNILGNILMAIRDSHRSKIDEDISLTEAKQVGLISYGVKGSDDASSVSMLDIILQSDKIKSSEVQADLYQDSDKDAFVSTSRDLLSHVKNNRQRPVGIVLDGDKLSDRYKIRPINWATLELDKEKSRLSLKELLEYTNMDNPAEKVYKVLFASYGSFFITKPIFDVLEKIMEYYNATETVNRKGEITTLGATHGFVANHNIGVKGKNAKMPKAANWRITKGYFYSVPNGGGVNVSKGTITKYKDRLAQDGIDLTGDNFISDLVHNKVLDESEERLLQKAVFSYTKTSSRGRPKKSQVDSYFNIKDCIKLILLPATYKTCWETSGKDFSYPYITSQGYEMLKQLDAALARDIVKLKATVINKGLDSKVFWVDNKSTNADVIRAAQ
jgi:ribA/ribD-fused uncharacterized protein